MIPIQRSLRYLTLKRFHSAPKSCPFRLCFRQLNTSTALQHEPRTFPTSGFDVVDASEEVEEETLPGYCPKKYYPVRLGEIFEQRYQVVGKLGYGTTSTVWLAHDLLSVIAILGGLILLLTTYSPGNLAMSPSRYMFPALAEPGNSRYTTI